MLQPKKVQSTSRRFSPKTIFLLAVSPVLISLIIHIGVLIYAHYVRWQWLGPYEEKGEKTAELLVEKEDDRLQFQGTDKLDSFEADDNLFDPVSEISYRPVVPDMEILPDSAAKEEMDIIAVEAAVLDSKWVNPATGGQPLDTGSEMKVASFSRHIQALREGGLDVVFVFDSTESMVDYLNAVKQKINSLALAFRKLVPTCRIGMVTYRDRNNDYVTKSSPLTYGVESLKDFLSKVEVKGGGDRREAVADGIKTAISDMEWNRKAKKFILVIGDAPPHKEDVEEAVKMIMEFREKNNGQVCVLEIRPPGNMTIDQYNSTILPNIAMESYVESYSFYADNEKVMEDFQAFADAGGGESARLHDEKKVIKHMLVLIFGTRWHMYLDEFLVNL
ncbi:MAG: VWA domain-containing protein [Proteobacteria bacterium]|nr:VWA domain-containing protein [Pseudomonadota bacterium]